MAYLLHPVFPAIDSAHVISAIHGKSRSQSPRLALIVFPDLPVWLKTSGKFIISLPFFFHSYNGIRHLVWDTGRGEYAGTGY
jgi:succinate dehydrogenase (ubiquinone) cytochrome b560 subunit